MATAGDGPLLSGGGDPTAVPDPDPGRSRGPRRDGGEGTAAGGGGRADQANRDAALPRGGGTRDLSGAAAAGVERADPQLVLHRPRRRAGGAAPRLVGRRRRDRGGRGRAERGGSRQERARRGVRLATCRRLPAGVVGRRRPSGNRRGGPDRARRAARRSGVRRYGEGGLGPVRRAGHAGGLAADPGRRRRLRPARPAAAATHRAGDRDEPGPRDRAGSSTGRRRPVQPYRVGPPAPPPLPLAGPALRRADRGDRRGSAARGGSGGGVPGADRHGRRGVPAAAGRARHHGACRGGRRGRRSGRDRRDRAGTPCRSRPGGCRPARPGGAAGPRAGPVDGRDHRLGPGSRPGRGGSGNHR